MCQQAAHLKKVVYWEGKVMTRGGGRENRVEMTESGLELNPKDTQSSRDPSYRCEFSTEWDTVKRGS